ncbi:ComF family protein [Dyella sp.]|uniref:ComF family protein n=1 Tax=Dyella sp. TaxID=1869338 RepID=UPI0039C8AC67
MDALDRCRRWLASSLLPWRCQLCGGAGETGMDLCAGCMADMPGNHSCCARCALPLPASIAMCGRCLKRAPAWDGAWVPFVYGWPLDSLESRFKFHGDLACGRSLSSLWERAGPPPRCPDLIVPVPLHRQRLRERGYNQALELARPLARLWRIPLRHDVLERSRASAPQTELDAVARRRNVRRAFVVPEGKVLPRHVAVIDDVMTTGATLAECAITLKRAGVQRVDAWALARASKKS